MIDALADLSHPIALGGSPVSLRDYLAARLAGTPTPPPSDDAVRRAAVLLEVGASHNFVPGAVWLEIGEALRAEGLGDEAIARLVVGCLGGEARQWAGPPPAVALHFLDPLDGRALAAARDVLRAAPASFERDLALALCALADDGLSPAEVAAHLGAELRAARLDLALDPRVLRRLLERLDPGEAEALLLAGSRARDGNDAGRLFSHLALVADVLPSTDAVRARLEELNGLLQGAHGQARRWEQVQSRARAERGEDGLTAQARSALKWTLDQLEVERLTACLGPEAEAAYATRVAVAGVPELAERSRWCGATAARREAIAQAVCAALNDALGAKHGFRVDRIASYRDAPVAVVAPQRGKLRLCLVPGGTYERGLSEAEEEHLRRAAAERNGQPNHHEEYGALLAGVHGMRPRASVTVGPLLMAQAPGSGADLAKLVRWLRKGPYRLPTEAEWEYCARGGREGELTHRGDALPDAAAVTQGKRQKDAAANAFGLWGFGLYPEPCADLHRPDYEGAPRDGAPVRGEGPRVVRGGAAQLWPWQQVGEWQLLLNAVRSSQDEWQDALFPRAVIGLRV